jgi:transposase
LCLSQRVNWFTLARQLSIIAYRKDDMLPLDFQDIVGEEIIITIEKGVKYSTCPTCGKPIYSIHQNHWRMIHDLPWNKKPVLLKINRRQWKCHKCKKVFSEPLDFVDKSKGYTKRLAADIVQQVLNSNVHSVAQRNGLSILTKIN